MPSSLGLSRGGASAETRTRPARGGTVVGAGSGRSGCRCREPRRAAPFARCHMFRVLPRRRELPGGHPAGLPQRGPRQRRAGLPPSRPHTQSRLQACVIVATAQWGLYLLGGEVPFRSAPSMFVVRIRARATVLPQAGESRHGQRSVRVSRGKNMCALVGLRRRLRAERSRSALATVTGQRPAKLLPGVEALDDSVLRQRPLMPR